MVNLWGSIRVWFQGKKTILGGGLVIAAGVAGVALGKLDPVTGVGVVGAGLSIAGFSAKANRNQTAILTGLQAVAQATADARVGNSVGAITVIEGAAGKLAPGLMTGVAYTVTQPVDAASASPSGAAAK